MLLIDAIVVKVRDAQVANRPVYVAIGVDLAGDRDVGGLWLGPAGGEGAKQWATMLTELRNRGLADALIVCCDGNGGPARVDPRRLARRDSPDLRRAHGPQQPPLCVYQAVGPDHQSHARDLCTAPTVGAAEARFAEFSADWADTYPAMIQSWHNSWDEFVPFLAFPAELRRVVYTTNAIESLNARFRRAVRHRGHFPNEQAAMKILYLVATARRKNGGNLVGKTNSWTTILNTLTVHYGDRIADHIR